MFILLGDYNIDLFKQASDIKSRSYLNDIYSAGCYSLTDKPTRIASTSETLLDHIYSNILHKPCLPGVLVSDVSDYLPTFCIVQENFAKKNQPKIQVRDMKHFNSELYCEDIINGVQSLIFCSDQEEYLKNLLLKLKEITDKHAPLRSLSQKETKI